MKKDVVEIKDEEQYCLCVVAEPDKNPPIEEVRRPWFQVTYRYTDGERIETPDSRGDDLGAIILSPGGEAHVGKLRLCEYCDGTAVQRARTRK